MSDRIATVLAVDCDEENLTLLKSILRLKGFDVLPAADGHEAVDLAFRWHPDLIVMELTLPLVNGFAVVQRVRRMPRLRDVPIISFSLSQNASHRELALAAGCAAHLEKPIDFDEFDALIDQLLPGYSLALISSLVH